MAKGNERLTSVTTAADDPATAAGDVVVARIQRGVHRGSRVDQQGHAGRYGNRLDLKRVVTSGRLQLHRSSLGTLIHSLLNARRIEVRIIVRAQIAVLGRKLSG